MNKDIINKSIYHHGTRNDPENVQQRLYNSSDRRCGWNYRETG